MPKPVKINHKQLRALLSEAIQTREPGTPLFTPPKLPKRNLQEMPGAHGRRMSGAPTTHTRLVTALENALREELLGMFDPGDPSMAEYGEEAWAEQVDAAVDRFSNDVLSGDDLDMIHTALINGEFFRG